MTLRELLPLMFEVGQVVVTIACTAVVVWTLSGSLAKYRRLKLSGQNGRLKRFRWMQVRTDGALLLVQLSFLFAAAWRLVDTDPTEHFWQYHILAGIRTSASILLAVKVLFNQRDATYLSLPGEPKH